MANTKAEVAQRLSRFSTLAFRENDIAVRMQLAKDIELALSTAESNLARAIYSFGSED